MLKKFFMAHLQVRRSYNMLYTFFILLDFWQLHSPKIESNFNINHCRKNAKTPCRYRLIIHGDFVGIDTTVCTYGSLVEFRKGSPLKLTPMKATIHILLINSKVQRETKTLVGKVAQLHRDYPRVIANVFEAMEEISLTAIKKLKTLSAAEEGL